MITTNIDSLCKKALLRKRIGMAYYVDCLLAATDCLLVLTLDDGMDVINFNKVPVNIDDNSVIIPDGAAVVTGVAVEAGQKLIQLSVDGKINSLKHYDTAFNSDVYNTGTNNIYSYKVITARNEIQLNEQLTVDSVVVASIGDGRNANAATRIEVSAEPTIDAYINWQLVENSSSYGMGEKERLRQLYISERIILRARNTHWDLDAIRKATVQVGRRRMEYAGEVQFRSN